MACCSKTAYALEVAGRDARGTNLTATREVSALAWTTKAVFACTEKLLPAKTGGLRKLAELRVVKFSPLEGPMLRSRERNGGVDISKALFLTTTR